MKEELFTLPASPAPFLRDGVREDMARRGVPAALIDWLRQTPAPLHDKGAEAGFCVLQRYAYRFRLNGRGEKMLESMESKIREGLRRKLFRSVTTDRALKWALVELRHKTLDNSTLPLVAAALACRAPDLSPLVEIQSADALRLLKSGWNGRGAD